jgi:hypothetical protein
MEDDLTAAKSSSRGLTEGRDSIQNHIDMLADRLEEAYRVTRENNKPDRERQKKQYDKGTKLTTFQPGEMVYLREMTKGKGGCPKFRIKWKGPYEVLRSLSDLNYLIGIARNKEMVVNVNKMKRCHRTIAPSSRTRADVPTREFEGGGRQSEKGETEVTSPIPYDHSDDSGSVDPALPTVIEREGEDQTQDPTWQPEREPEIQLPPERTVELGEDSGARYELRSRQAGAHDITQGPQAEVNTRKFDTAARETEPPASLVDETGSDQGRGAPSPRYHLRPLPGRKL